MGYKRPTLKLVFEDDPELEGLEVRARRLSIGAALDLAALVDLGVTEMRNDRSKLQQLIGAIASPLISWNLEDHDDTPIPATADGLALQDPGFVTGLALALLRASVGVSRPLGQISPDGQPSPEASLPMETLPAEALSGSPGS